MESQGKDVVCSPKVFEPWGQWPWLLLPDFVCQKQVCFALVFHILFCQSIVWLEIH